MNDADRFKLLHGPYRSPRCRIGSKLFCEVRGWVSVRAMSDGRIVWPMTSNKRGVGGRSQNPSMIGFRVGNAVLPGRAPS